MTLQAHVAMAELSKGTGIEATRVMGSDNHFSVKSSEPGGDGEQV